MYLLVLVGIRSSIRIRSQETETELTENHAICGAGCWLAGCWLAGWLLAGGAARCATFCNAGAVLGSRRWRGIMRMSSDEACALGRMAPQRGRRPQCDALRNGVRMRCHRCRAVSVAPAAMVGSSSRASSHLRGASVAAQCDGQGSPGSRL